ncbi:glycosyltransferase family 4 protein [Rhodopseudomonas palustris]|uniref:glycosyltransferase family 4 protein n=1 Tax=Rhodopseudomonas palustris TaxID=1076 RepID=UPI0022F0A849|nr:glycosyltransferase family 4 protein [Rhodopseudomonas palustris]WBU32397.1 glycosyltransferase family 4 protein [Rhodopseudomonas palustris]
MVSAVPPRSMRRRVLVIQTQAENAGAQEISRLVGAGLTARGYDVHNLFFFRQSRGFDEPVNTTYCAPRRPGNPLAFLRFLVSLGRQIRAARPDAILTFQHYGNAIGGAIARLVSPAPVIANQVSARLTMPGWLQKLDLMMGRLGVFNTITVNSEDMLHDYSRYPDSYRRRLTHVPHGFDQKHSALTRAEARRRFALPVDGVMLGTAARLHPLKQLDATIRVLPAKPSWRLALAGHGPDEVRLRALAEQLGVADRIFFVGEITPEQVADFLASLDVFVFPSLAETFGLAAVEAAHAGVPVVANDLPVLREVLAYQGEPAALLVDASDTAALGAAISAVLDDPALRVRLQRSGEGLKTRYSVDAMVDEYVHILEQAM